MHTSSTENIIAASALHKIVESSGGPLHILQDISLTINHGEAVAILGASGSGKSTLLGLLAGLDTPTGGTSSLFGHNLGQLDEDGRAALRAGQVGFVFQSFQLLTGMTALENVMLPLELAGSKDPRILATAALEDVGLGDRLTHYPAQLSGGEQQRVAVARAFASQPRILFADEPTANLDSKTGERIADLLFSMREKHRTVLLLVTHDQSLAARCDRTLLLVEGKLETEA